MEETSQHMCKQNHVVHSVWSSVRIKAQSLHGIIICMYVDS